MHGVSSTVHNNQVIRRISARAFREHGIVFHSIDQVKRYDSLSLLNEHGDLYFWHNFGIQFISNKLGKLKKIIRKEEKIKLKVCRKAVTRGYKL